MNRGNIGDGRGERVSIVIPCYNRAALIGDAIESAIAHGDGAEVVVVDDGSTDTSWERISAFGNRIRGFRLSNGGVSAARNFGVRQSTGTHIKFLDSDDRLPPGAVAALIEAGRHAAPRQVMFGDARSIGPAGQPVEPAGYGFADVAPPGPLPLKLLLSGTMSPYLPLYPAEALQAAGGFDPRYDLGEDQELAVRLALSGFRFHRVPVVVAEVREHPGERLSRTGTFSLYDRHIALFTGIEHQLGRADPPLTSAERLAFATTIWTVARDAARVRCRAQAKRLFALATELSGPVAAAPARLQPLYRLLDPYRAEQLLEAIKKLRPRRLSGAGRGTAGASGS